MSSNVESLLSAILTGDEKYIVVPQSRVEELLLAIYKNGGGGGGGGTAGIKYLGVIDNYKNLSTTAKKGDYYLAGTADKDKNVHVGDMLIAQKDAPAATIDNSNYRLLHTELDTDTTYTITQDSTDKHIFYFKASTETGTGTKITIPDNDTKTTAASDEKAATKLYLVGTMTQDANGVKTYANAKVYIGTDDCLYSNGKKVAIQEDVDKKANKTSVSSSTETTSVINVTDAKAQMAMVATIIGKTVKDGTTLKSAAVESVVSRSTKPTWRNGVYNASGVITDASAYISTTMMPIKGGDTIAITVSENPRIGRVYFFDKDNKRIEPEVSFDNNSTKTVTAHAGAVSFGVSFSNASSNVRVETAPTMTFKVNNSYFAGGVKTTVLVPSEARNCVGYGLGISDSICNIADFENSVYTQAVGVIDLGSLTYTYGKWGNGNTFKASLDSSFKLVTSSTVYNAICGKYKCVHADVNWNHEDNKVFSIHNASGSVLHIVDDSMSASDVVDGKVAKFKGVMLVYELASAKTTPLKDFIRPLPVEQGGTLTLVNEHNLDMPSVIKYKKEV